MFKAIIESIENNGYSAKIRIPFFNGYSSSIGSTNEYELYTASICSAPGCDPAYQVGDIVYIDFEDRDEGKPVIVGIFYRQDYLSSANINTQSLNVAVSAEFPEETAIGNVNKNNIKSLTRVSDNVQYQLAELTGNIKNISGEIPTKVSQLENDLNFVNEDALQTVENSIPTKVSQLTNDENYTDIEQLNNVSNMYVWEVFKSTGIRLENFDSLDIVNNSTVTVYYSNSISAKPDNSIVLNSYSTINLTASTSSSTTDTSVSNANNTLKNKYIRLGTDSTVYKVSENSNFVKVNTGTTWSPQYKISLDVSQKVFNICILDNYIADFNINTYPQSGIKDNYYYYLLSTLGSLSFKNAVDIWIWLRYTYTPPSYSYVESSNIQFTNSTSTSNWYYSTEIKISSSGSIELLNPAENYVQIARTSTTTANTYLVGKYIKQENYSTIYYIPSDANFYRDGNPLYVSKIQTISGIAQIKTFDSYICDLYEYAYPDNNYINNYWYKKQYKLIDKLNDFESRITALENASTT